VQLIDAIARAWEREEILRAMNEGHLGVTLCDAADAGGMQDVCFLLAAGVDAGAERGRALSCACFGGHIRVAEALLNAGGTLTPHHRNEALYVAVNHGRTACCELLLDCGVDIYSTHYRIEGGLAYVKRIRCAAWHGNLETVACLLDRGADAWSRRAMQYAPVAPIKTR